MKKPNVSFIVLVVFIGTVLCFYFFNPDFKKWIQDAYTAFSSGEINTIRSFMAPYKDIAYLILLGAFIMQLFLFFIPSALVMSLCIITYGPWWGGLLCLAGVFIASVFGYVLGDTMGDYTLDKLIGHNSRKKMEDFLKRYGFLTVLVFRLSPFLSNDAVSFVAGLVGMKFWRFIAATMLGITPLTILLAWIGESNAHLKSGMIITGVVSLLALGVYIYIDKKRDA